MRFPTDHYAYYQAEAARAGMDFNAYLNWVLARWHELSDPERESDAAQVQRQHLATKPRPLEGAA